MVDKLDHVIADVDENINVGTSCLVDNPDDCSKILNTSQTGIKMIVQNIRSLNKNFEDFLILLTRLKLDFDLIILTECWLPHVSELPVLPGYTSYQTQNHINQNSGVTIYAKHTLNVTVHEPLLKEADSLVIDINKEYALVCIYRSPSFKSIENFIISLDQLLSGLKNYKHIILTGDLNIDITEIDENKSNIYLNLLAMHGLLTGHSYPTRGNNCLDHFFARSTLKSLCVVCQTTVTDHSTLIIVLFNSVSLHKIQQKYLKRTDYTKALTELNGVDWSIITSNSDPNSATYNFLIIIKNILDKYSTQHIMPNRKRTTKPWVTPGLLRCIKFRDKLHLRFRKNPEDQVLKISYIRYRNYCNGLLKNLKRMYERKQINENKKDIKRTWNIIKQICNLNTDTKTPMELLNIRPSQLESVNCVNNYFVNIGQNLASDILGKHPAETDKATTTNSDNTPRSSLMLLPTCEEEIRKIILSLKNSVSTGWDGISSVFMKKAIDSLIKPITYISNICLQYGIFPTVLKQAVIVPVYKSGDRDNVSNYRPIALLPCLSKIIEKLINIRLLNFLESQNLLSCNQYGFREKRSTSDAIERLVSHISDKLDKKQKCLGVFLDMAKAFDTVSVPNLLNKLEHLGIRGVPLDLFTDYLSNRSQVVKINDVISDSAPIYFGVPQGSVLGPSLFIIYINELCRKKLKNAEIITFADDTVVVFHDATWDGVKKVAEEGLASIMKWLNRNILTLNLSKTKYITFTIKNNDQPLQNSLNLKAHVCDSFTLNCNCHVVDSVSSIKYLGVLIDQNLNWKIHINNLTSRLRKLITLFKKIRHINDVKTVKTVYYSLCQSIATYGILAWGGAAKTYLIKIERAQRAIIKIINFKNFRYPTVDLYKEYSVLTIRQLFIKSIILKQHTKPSQILNKRRPFIVYPVPFCRTSFAQKFFPYLGPFVYNRINKSVCISKCSKFVCKNILDEYLKKMDYDSTEKLLVSVV